MTILFKILTKIKAIFIFKEILIKLLGKVCQIQNKSAIKSLNLFYYILVEHSRLTNKTYFISHLLCFYGEKKLKK
jgi:hypothetical protein